MKPHHLSFSLFALLGGCGGTPFLIGNFDSNYKAKLKTVAVMPFLLPGENRLAENQRPTLEEKITGAIVRSDSLHSYLFPYGVRSRFFGTTDSAVLRLPADSAGKFLLAEALLYSEVIRLYQSTGDNPTTRQIGGAKFQRRGCELLMEFRLVDAASSSVLWKYRVRRFGVDVEMGAQLIGQAAATVWPLRI